MPKNFTLCLSNVLLLYRSYGLISDVKCLLKVWGSVYTLHIPVMSSADELKLSYRLSNS